MTNKPEKKADQREYPRVQMPFNKATVQRGEIVTEVQIGNMSRSGALIHSTHQFMLGDLVTMQISGIYQGDQFHEDVPGRVVTAYRRSDGNSYGLQFSTLLYMDHTPALAAFLDRDQGDKVSFLRDPRYRKAERKA